MPTRNKPHPFQNWRVKVKSGEYTGTEFLLYDWYERYFGGPDAAMDRPAFSVIMSREHDRLIREGIKLPEEVNNLVYGLIGDDYHIFQADQLDLEYTRSKGP